MSNIAEKREQLLATLRSYESCAVALSAGVDSAVVAKAAQLALGDAALAVTGTSHSLAAGELDQARRVAVEIGIRHRIVSTGEFANPAYVRNSGDRCYHCKTELYSQLEGIAAQLDVAVVASGANADDLGDYRPGLQAAREHRVCNPLAECGITKTEVRQLARDWGLSVWDKPATPCLSSRIAYGEEVTPERLSRIDQAEQYLRRLDLQTVRVRYHRGDIARLEVPGDAIARLASPEVRSPLVAYFKSIGFKFVALDLEGFRSGSLNNMVTLDSVVASTERSW